MIYRAGVISHPSQGCCTGDMSFGADDNAYHAQPSCVCTFELNINRLENGHFSICFLTWLPFERLT